jgi:hypothetical protein
MSTSAIEIKPLVIDVSVSESALRATLADGREVSVPLAWFPRLQHASLEQRRNWRLIGAGVGIHWPDVDEDISAASLLATR